MVCGRSLIFFFPFDHRLFPVSSVGQFICSLPVSLCISRTLFFPGHLRARRVAGAWIQFLAHSVQFLCAITSQGWKGQKGQDSSSMGKLQIRFLCCFGFLCYWQDVALLPTWTFSVMKEMRWFLRMIIFLIARNGWTGSVASLCI